MKHSSEGVSWLENEGWNVDNYFHSEAVPTAMRKAFNCS